MQVQGIRSCGTGGRGRSLRPVLGLNNIPFDPYDFFGYLGAGILLMVGMDVLFGFPHVVGADLKLIDGGIVVLMAYVAGQLVAGPSRLVLETLIIGKLLKRPSVNLFRKKRPWMRWLLFPGYYEPLPAMISARVLEKAREGGITDLGEPLYLYVRYNDATLANERLMKRLDSFVDKYGFSRNLAFTCFLLAAAFFVKNKLAHSPELLKYGTTAVIGGVLLFYRSLKFYRQNSYELFNTFAGRK